MRITPHLFFDGECEAAFRHYQSILGGAFGTIMKYGESPMAANVDAQWHERIVHASLQVGTFELAGADLLPQDFAKPQGFAVILSFPDTGEAERVCHLLSKGGEVQMPFQPTFWSAGFAVFKDRFGIAWEINCDVPPMPETLFHNGRE